MFLVHQTEITVQVESYLYSTVLINIVMGWTQENINGAFYNFSIEPQATITKMYNTFVQMEVLYNTMYEVNVEANNTQ